jgi:hypothetical protein
MATAPQVRKQNKFGVSRKYVQAAKTLDHRASGTPEAIEADARGLYGRWSSARARANSARNKK